jgi:hypothetical protein
VTIDGDTDGDGSADVTVDGGNVFRVFHATSGTSTLDSLTIAKGYGVNRDAPSTPGKGGGLFISSGATVHVTDSTLSGNAAGNTFGESPPATFGGAVFNAGTVTLSNSTLSGNSARSGGGLYNAGTATLTNTTLSGNRATEFGGGVVNYTGDTLTLINSTISGNTATFGGGGVFNNGTATLTNSIVLGNSGTATDFENFDNYHLGTYTLTTSVTSGTPSDVFAATGAYGAGVLADNGGPVQTIALKQDVNNPALNIGFDGAGLLTDAIGNARAFDLPGIGAAIVDAGAVEVQGEVPSLIVTIAEDTVDVFDGETSLREAVAYANSNADASTITFDIGSGSHTITLGSELVLSTDVTIDGDTDADGAADVTIDGNDASRVFQVTGATTDVSLRSLDISNGSAANGFGGAIFSSGSSLTIVNSTIRDSAASNGGGIAAIDVRLANSTISGNAADAGGGLFLFGGGTGILDNTTLSGNSATSNGGGIGTNPGTTLTIRNSTITDNAGGPVFGGGGVTLGNSTAVVQNSIISGNTGSTSPDIAKFGVGTLTAQNSLLGAGVAIDTDNGGNVSSDTPGLGALADNGGPVQTHALQQGSFAISAGDASLLAPDTLDVDGDADTTELLPIAANGNPRVIGAMDIGAVELQVPVLAGLARSVTYAETTVSATPQLLDADVRFTDSGGTLPGGTLVVSGVLSEDVLSVANIGTGAGQIGLSGTTVSYGGVTIGTLAGGTGTDLTVSLTANATPEAVDALIEALTYFNSAGSPTLSRDLSITVTNAGGVDAGAQMITVDLSSTSSEDVSPGTEGDDLFFTGQGADINEGRGGDDTFWLSDTLTLTDAIWESRRFTYSEMVATSSGLRATVSLTDKVRVEDNFLGGDGWDRIIGTDLGEALLLYDPNFSATNSALASFNARIIAIESFEMGGGDDIVNLTAGTEWQGFLADAFIDGGAGRDYLFGGAGNDEIIGGLGPDGLIGWRGNDVLTGGVAGGDGDGTEDRFVFSSGSAGGVDVITDFEDGIDKIYLLGFGVQSYADAVSGVTPLLQVALGGSSPELLLTYEGIETRIVLEGFSGTVDSTDFVFIDDTAIPVSDPGTNATPISGSAGDVDEQLTGTAQHDTFQVGGGADILEGLEGDDRFELSSASGGTWGEGVLTYAEQVARSNGMLWQASLTGKVHVDDTFLGGRGHDVIVGSTLGEAILLYEPNYTAANSILANFDARIISVEEFDMGGGDDIVDLTSTASQQGFISDATLLGGSGNDHLFSGAGNDVVIGGTGTDWLIGWRGDDVLTGGEDGGSGDGEIDRFIFGTESGGGKDRITDFEVNTDKITVLGFGVSNYAEALDSGVLSVVEGPSDTVLTLSDGALVTIIELTGVTALSSADFEFLA